MAVLSRETYGSLLLLLSALCYSIAGCFIKLAANTGGLASSELVFIRAIFQGVITVGAMFCYKEEHNHNKNAQEVASNNPQQQQLRPLICVPFGSSRTMIQLVALHGIVVSVAFIIYFYSIQTLPLGDAITLLSLYPIVTVFLARLILGEPIRPCAVLATLLSCVGAVLIAGPTFLTSHNSNTDIMIKDNNNNWIGYTIALFGSFVISGVIVLVRASGNEGAHALQLMFSWCFFGIIASLFSGFVIHMDNVAWKMPTSYESWGYVLGLSLVGTLAHFLLTYAGRMAPANLAGVMRSTDVVWAYGLEIVFFHQVPSVATLVGALLIILSPFVIALQPKLGDDEGARTTSQQQQQLLQPEQQSSGEQKSLLPSNCQDEERNDNPAYAATK